MIALCSKTYVLKQADGEVKFSSKDTNKSVLTAPSEMSMIALCSKRYILEVKKDKF